LHSVICWLMLFVRAVKGLIWAARHCLIRGRETPILAVAALCFVARYSLGASHFGHKSASERKHEQSALTTTQRCRRLRTSTLFTFSK
jgi:hypothetical protein